MREATGRIPSLGVGHQLLGRGGDLASYPMDDVHQARMAQDVGAWRMTFGEDSKKNRLNVAL